MAVLGTMGGGQPVVLGTGQSGNVDTTNTADRGAQKSGAALIAIASTAGTTVTVTAFGSMDGSNFFAIGLATTIAPLTFAGTVAITTTTTTYLIVSPDVPWRYLKVNYSANTGMTGLGATVYPA